MANILEILIQAKNAASPAFRDVATSATAMGNSVDAAANKMASASTKAAAFEKAAQKVDGAGRQARIGLSSMSQAAQLVGIDLTGIIGPASSAADAIGDIVGAAGSLGLIGIAVGAATIAFGLLRKAYEELRAETVKSITTNNDYIRNLYALGQAYPAVAAATKNYAEALANLRLEEEKADRAGMNAVVRQSAFATSLHEAQAAANAAKASLDAMTFGIQSGYDEVEHLRGAISGLVDTSESADAILQRLAASHNAAAAAAAAQAAEEERLTGILAGQVNAAASLAQADATVDGWMVRLNAGNRAYNDIVQRGKTYTDAHNEALKKWASEGATAATRAASQLNAKLRALVEGALSPTAVTDADQQAAAMGKYVDKWDEFRRQLEAVATGTDPTQFGEEFVKNFDALGMSAEQAAQAFKDFSLFADPKNIKLVNMAPIVEDVKHQLDEMIGKANLTSAAMKEVWKNLSPTQKAALAEQGIEDVNDAVKSMLDPAGAAKDKVAALNTEIDGIPALVTTTFNAITEAAATAIKTFQDEILDPFIAKYQNVTISINAETSATEPPPPPPPPDYGNKFQRGADFVVPKGFPNDTFSFRGMLTSGEHVQITPPNKRAANGGASFNFYVTVDSDARARTLSRHVRALAAAGLA